MSLRIQRVMLVAASNMEGALANEFLKGEYAAFSLVIRYPELIMDQIKSEIEVESDAT